MITPKPLSWCHDRILNISPSLTLGNKVLLAVGQRFPEAHLFSAAALRLFIVRPFEILRRVTVNRHSSVQKT